MTGISRGGPAHDLDSPETTIARRALIARKPFLRALYDEWYEALLADIETRRPVLEVGAGAGFLSERVPGLIASDVLRLPHVRLVANAIQMPFRDRSLGAIVMTNVLHHIADPERFFREAARIVRPGGAMAMIEPWVSPWSRFVYRRLHHEPFDPAAADWRLPPGGPLSTANGAIPWMLFERDASEFERRCAPWRVRSIRRMMPFSYLLSGGMTTRASLPGTWYASCRAWERRLKVDERLAMFACITLDLAG